MISALREHGDDPKQTQDYLDKQIAHTERINKESILNLEAQFLKKEATLRSEINELRNENDNLIKEANEHKILTEKIERE